MQLTKIHRVSITIVVISLLLVFSGCGTNGSSSTDSNAGKLVQYDFARDYSAQEVAQVTDGAFSQAGENISDLVDSSTAAKAYIVEYYTTDVNGQLIIASGLVALPTPATGEYPIAVYMHGTMFNDQGVPSCTFNDPDHEALLTIALFAGHGYVAVMPDYIGQGKGAKVARPYLHAATTATSTADMLKAVKELTLALNVRLNFRLFICGLSQGGHATMALQRYIESTPVTQPFNLTASAPFAGPYSIPIAWDYWLQNNPPGVSPLVVHLILAYKRIYGFSDTLSDIFLPPYDTTVESIDDGTRDGDQMYKLLPTELTNLLQASFTAKVNNKTHPFYNAMVANSTYSFAPTTPTRLYHAINDELIPYSSSVFTQDHMKSLGAKQVELVILSPEWDHVSSFRPSMLSAKRWFDTF
jgi:pimeloyl-ACP methyl ester carboxylesterase